MALLTLPRMERAEAGIRASPPPRGVCLCGLVGLSVVSGFSERKLGRAHERNATQEAAVSGSIRKQAGAFTKGFVWVFLTSGQLNRKEAAWCGVMTPPKFAAVSSTPRVRTTEKCARKKGDFASFPHTKKTPKRLDTEQPPPGQCHTPASRICKAA